MRLTPHTPARARIAQEWRFLYGDSASPEALFSLLQRVNIPPRHVPLDQTSAILITYGDHIQHAPHSPLAALADFAQASLRDWVSTIHILPFYPSTSDDGFAVADYDAVDPTLGTWADLARLGEHFGLMFDLVLNHVSASHPWFQAYLRGEAQYQDYFIALAPETDLSQVVRPRTHPLLTPFETHTGTRHIWTTFSTDQIDLNPAHPPVLLELIQALLHYAAQGADFIRLDAIAYLWKQVGTNCIHLPQTHSAVRLLRAVLDECAPHVRLITETNVPHIENLSYFGDGQHEAQLVYQFALPPLLLHALESGDGRTLSAWAHGLATPSEHSTFFNFTASHDGVGVRPLTGLLPDADIQALARGIVARGGQVSYKTNSDGTQSPYELNCTYFDALMRPNEALELSVARFLVSQAIMLALAGVPGIYLPSLFGAGNWQAGYQHTGRARTLNRQKFERRTLDAALMGTGRAGQVWQGMKRLLSLRRQLSAFHPQTPQRVLELHPQVFAVQRGEVLALHNLSAQPITLDLPSTGYRDLLTGISMVHRCHLSAYQVAWLMP